MHWSLNQGSSPISESGELAAHYKGYIQRLTEAQYKTHYALVKRITYIARKLVLFILIAVGFVTEM